MEQGRIEKEGSATLSHGDVRITGDLNVKWNIAGEYGLRKLVIEVVSHDFITTTLQQMPFSEWVLDGNIDGIILNAQDIVLMGKNGEIGDRNSTKCIFGVGELRIGNETLFDQIEYYVPNVLIGFDNFQNIDNERVRNCTTLNLNYNGEMYSIVLEGVNNVVRKREEYKRDLTTFISTKVIVRKAAGDKIDINNATEIVDALLDLCTIAYGDRVNWVAARGYNNNEVNLEVLLDVECPVTNPFRYILRFEYPNRLSNFLFKTFDNYISMEESKRKIIMKLISSIQISSKSLIFPLPFSIMGLAIEDFVQGMLSEVETHYIDRTTRHRIDPIFDQWVAQNVLPVLTNAADRQDFQDGALKQKLA